MFKRTAIITTLAVALAGAPVAPAFAGQGKSQGHQKSQVAKGKSDKGKSDKGNRGQGNGQTKTKVKGDGNGNGNDGVWTADERARYGRWLPAGWTLEQGAAGFPNRGQFIAALNASHEHNVAFAQLKDLMVTRGMSLGEALRTLGR
jgi:hypothetical protein